MIHLVKWSEPLLGGSRSRTTDALGIGNGGPRAAAPRGYTPGALRLQQLLDAGRVGGCTIVVTGAPGVGKSAWASFLAGNRAGNHVGARSVRGVPWETGRAYGVLAQFLERTDDPDEMGDPGDAGLAQGVGPLEAAAWVWDRLPADRSTLLIVDDAHWADHESLRALASMTRHHPHGRNLVVLLVGPGDASATDSPTRQLLAQCADETWHLEGLETAGVTLLAGSLGLTLRPAVTEALTRHTNGIPRYVVELIEELPRASWNDFVPHLPAPKSVAATVQERLGQCSADASEVAEMLAVCGPEAPLRSVVGLVDHSIDAFAAVEELVGAELIWTAAPWAALELHFANPMVQAAVLDAMGAERVAAMHRRAAEQTASPESRLRHLVAANSDNDPRLADELETLAGERAGEGAWRVAAELLLDASRLTDDPELRAVRVTRAVDAIVGSGDALAAATLLPELESMREPHCATPYSAISRYCAVAASKPGRGSNDPGIWSTPDAIPRLQPWWRSATSFTTCAGAIPSSWTNGRPE